MKALAYDVPDYLDQPALENPEDLVYNRLYPFRYIPDTSKEMKTYIVLSFDDYRTKNGSFKSGKVTFNVFTHHSLQRTSYGKLRPDFIIEEIHKLISDSRGLGIGKAEFQRMNGLSINSDYHGSYIEYKVYDFK